MVALSSEDVFLLKVKHSDGGLSDNESAVVITGCANADERVREGQENLAFRSGCRELWECKSALNGGLLDLSCGGTNQDCGSEWVNVSARGAFGYVDPAGSAANDGSVR